MKLIIDIDEEIYKMCKRLLGDADEIERAIAQGIPYEERQHGRWIIETTDDLPVPFEHIVCSNCKKEAIVDDWHCYVKSDYCPNCGADMRGDKE